MSTRATYSFDTEMTHKQNVFYIHFDNYPEGAAYYFWVMHNHRHYKGGLGEIFFKANADVTEFTESHEYHGDTEYRYHMDQQGQLTVEKVVYEPKRAFVPFFRGHYAEFINQYSKALSTRLTEKDKFEPLYRLSDDLMTNTYWQHSRLSGHNTSCYGYLTLSEVKVIMIKLMKEILEDCQDNWLPDALTEWSKECQRLLQLQSMNQTALDPKKCH